LQLANARPAAATAKARRIVPHYRFRPSRRNARRPSRERISPPGREPAEAKVRMSFARFSGIFGCGSFAERIAAATEARPNSKLRKWERR